MCILFVEDDFLISVFATELVEADGHEVLAAYNADMAIEHVLTMRGRFSFLITDFNMPGSLNGMDVVNWTRTHYPSIPIIMATALGHVISRPWLARQRVTLIEKPYAAAALLTAVQRGLRPDELDQ